MGIFNFLETPEGRSKAGQAVQDVTNRGIAGLLGGPVDLAAMALKPLGYENPAPIGSSEWIGNLMEQAGMVSAQRYPVPEFLMSMALPGIGPKGAKAVGLFSEGLSTLGGSASRAGGNSVVNQIGAISPEGKARLLADLQARKGSGTYRLGDVTEGQLKALQRLGLEQTASRDVMMTNGLFSHLQNGRVHKDNFSPEDLTRFAEQAMSKSSQAELNTAKAHQNPALVNRRLLDAESGKRYDAQMPLKVENGSLTPATIFPRGLPGRNKKPSGE